MTSVPRPARTCSHPGCRIDAHKRGLCPTHYREHTQRNLANLHATQTPTQRRHRYGAAWQRQRKRILERDGNACVYCGTDQRLEVHHLANTDRPTDAQLVTLCNPHHRAIEAETKRGTIGKVGRAVAQWITAAGGYT